MSIQTAATAIDFAAMGFAFGATVWFFFIQSPVLLKRLGREAFVPLQMRLTVVLFQVLTAATLVALAASSQLAPIGSTVVGSAALAALGALINKFIVVPRALRAGGRSRKDIRGLDHEASSLSFADRGAGQGTKFFHRLVVVFVVVMLVGIGGHAAAVLSL